MYDQIKNAMLGYNNKKYFCISVPSGAVSYTHLTLPTKA